MVNSPGPYLNINAMSLKTSLPFLTRLDKSSTEKAFFKEESEERKYTLQSFLYPFWDPLHFAIRFARSIQSIYAKITMRRKNKSDNHRVTAPLIPRLPGYQYLANTVPELPRSSPRGVRGFQLSNDRCITSRD